MESLEKLHRESDEELRELWPKTANVVWSTARKFKNYAKIEGPSQALTHRH
jgi:hypothetical protein